MESVNKSFDVNEVFADVEKSFEKYKSVDLDDIFEEGKVCSALSIEIVSGLTDILRSVPKMPNSEIVDRVCEFVDMVNDKEGEIWSLSRKGKGKDGEVLISFLKELASFSKKSADKKWISQIDKIFRAGSYRHPLVNNLSCNPMIKNEFNEMFSKLPEDYQNKLLGETISYEEGDKTYTYSLIGGSALMGF